MKSKTPNKNENDAVENVGTSMNMTIPVKTQINFIEKEITYIQNEIYLNKKLTSISRCENVVLENKFSSIFQDLVLIFLKDLGNLNDNLKETKINLENENRIIQFEIKLISEENEKVRCILVENKQQISKVENEVGIDNKYSKQKE